MSKADNVYDPVYGSFVGDQGTWSTAKMYFTVPPNDCQTAGTVDVYGLQILDGRSRQTRRPAEARVPRRRGCHAGHPERGLDPALTALGNFLARSNSQSSAASASRLGTASNTGTARSRKFGGSIPGWCSSRDRPVHAT